MFLHGEKASEARVIQSVSSLKDLVLHKSKDDDSSSLIILDCRSVPRGSLIQNIPTLLSILLNEGVSQVWISVDFPYFMEIRHRLLNCSKMDSSLKHDALFKLILEDELSKRDTGDIIRSGDEVRHIAKVFASVKNFQKVCDGHPGLWGYVKKTSSLNVQSKWKNSEVVKRKFEDEPCAYDDRRRPKRKMIQELGKHLVALEETATEDGKEKPLEASEIVRRCYMCKTNKPTDSVRICSDCNKLNLEMINWKVDLSGRIAIVTGARVKIGFEISLRLLRNGCTVLATSRFPHDALLRYQQLPDWSEIKGKIKIAKLDFLNIQTVGTFVKYFSDNYSHLDILINNAAQTIHRDASYYTPMLEKEDVLRLHQDNEEDKKILIMETCLSSKRHETQIEYFPIRNGPVIGEDPVDESPRNSWTFNLDEVPLSEMLEVLTINTIGPFLLTSRLKPFMTKSPFPKRFVVNVSAMEGQFSRLNKGHRHAHTNMAKAALNMMTRTAGLEFLLDNIFMTSADTGWVTDERPMHQATYEKVIRGFDAPLSEEDGAARVIHPVFHGLSCKEEEQPYFAVFLKDFKAYPW